jgi:hypothetical protein
MIAIRAGRRCFGAFLGLAWREREFDAVTESRCPKSTPVRRLDPAKFRLDDPIDACGFVVQAAQFQNS